MLLACPDVDRKVLKFHFRFEQEHQNLESVDGVESI